MCSVVGRWGAVTCRLMGPRLLCLLLMLPSPSAMKREGGGRIEDGVVRHDALGAELWEAPGALSSAECESIRAAGAAGAAMDGSKMLEASVGETDPTEIRSTELQWLGSGRPEVDLLREKLFSVAKRADQEAGWATGRLHRLENLQVGVYSAAAGGHYTWHSDQDWAGAARAMESEGARLLTVIVQLSVPDEYWGGELQVGLVNASKAQVREGSPSRAVRLRCLRGTAHSACAFGSRAWFSY